MRKFGLLVAFLLSTLLTVGFAGADEKTKGEDKAKGKQPVTALPPHPLDAVFQGNNNKDVTDALINNELYKKAVTEALKAKKIQEQRFKDNPRLADASPDQVARRVFLETLMDKQEK